MSPRSTQQQLVTLERCSLVLGGETVLDDISFELRARQRWALIGANGAGKTLLLKLLRGDLWPTPTGVESRTYYLDPDAGFSGSSQPAGSKHQIAYIGPERQDRYLRRDWNLAVRQIVTTGLFDEDIPLTTPTTAQSARITRLLKRFGLWRLRGRRFLTLSYGQRRLALVARAFAGHPRVLLLDEVFNGLDDTSRRRLRRALEHPGPRSPAWILATHRPGDLPASVTHVARLRLGRLVEAGAFNPQRASATPAPRRQVTKPLRLQPARLRPTSTGAPLIRIRNANVYRDYRPVLKAVNWTIANGEHWGIIGRNGSGKSTLLTMLYGDRHPALGGVIERRGIDPGTHIETWKRRVGLVSPELQAEHYRAGSLEEIIVSGRYASIGLNTPPTPADLKAARHWLGFFGLTALASREPRAVSYGQLRLALIARALVLYPVLLLLDEPFTGLDADLRTHTMALIQQIAVGGTQVVMAVHHPADLIPAIGQVLEVRPGGRIALSQRHSRS